MMLPTPNTLPTGAEAYRKPMSVSFVRYYPACPELSTYPLCPRCSLPMEREYQNYCAHCGQALDWRTLSNAIIVLAKSSNDS